jgi:hypothetical protein
MGPGIIMMQEKVVFSSGGTLEIRAFSLVSIAKKRSEIMVCLGCSKSKTTPFLFQKTVHNILPVDGCILNIFFNAEFPYCHSADYRIINCGSQW